MSVFRAFIAVELPEEIHQTLAQVSADLKQKMGELPVRWVAVHNIHLTLKFLGDVSEANVPMLTKIIQMIADGHHCLEISLGSLGAFPNVRRPRVIWVGVQAPEELVSIHRSLDVETTRLGYESDKRPFSPHLTLGRVSRNASPREVRGIGQVLKEEKLGFLGAARVSELHLFRSDLKPGGAVYTKVFTAALRDETR
jgi:2'-5' RNA ligase